MEAFVNALKKFLMRDLSFILGGGAVILSFLSVYEKIPCQELPIAIYVLAAGFAYVIGYAIQDTFTLLHVVRTKAAVSPSNFGKWLFERFERKDIEFEDLSKYEEAKEWLFEEGHERFQADHERTESLKQVGTTMGSCLIVCAAILFGVPMLQKVKFELALSIGVLTLGVVLCCLACLKVTQQGQYVLARWNRAGKPKPKHGRALETSVGDAQPGGAGDAAR